MNEILLRWLSLSFSGSLAVLMILLFRPLFRRFGGAWNYYIWLLVLLRLSIPLSPQISLAGSLFQEVETRFAPEKALTAEDIPSGAADFEAALSASGQNREAVQKSQEDAPAVIFLRSHLLGILWLGAAICLLLRRIYSYCNFIRAVQKDNKAVTEGALTEAVQSLAEAWRIKRKIQIYRNPLVRAPMLLGMLRPAIVLPDGLTDYSELYYIFRHEMTHYRRMDFLYKWFTEITVCIHWFNPIVYFVRRQVNRECELSCDESVISRLKEEERRSYGNTLLNAVTRNSSSNNGMISLSLNEDGRLIKERLDAIMKYHRKSKAIVFTAAVCTIFLCGATVFAGAYTEPGGDHIVAIKQPEGNAREAAGHSENILDETDWTVIIENVEMRRYEGDNGHPYIHDRISNHTEKDIIGYEQGMLAFDREGNPLQIDWYCIDFQLDSSYFYLYESSMDRIASGETQDLAGGWSLNFFGEDSAAEEIAYVLYCDKQITFADGTI